MDILNKEQIDKFLFDHRENGCISIQEGLRDEQGLLLNTTWVDRITKEEIGIVYE